MNRWDRWAAVDAAVDQSMPAVLHCAPPIPHGMHLFQWNGTGIRWNPVEWDRNPAEFWNSSGIHRNGPEFWWNPQEWTGIPAESARVDWNLRNLQEWTRICRNVVWNLHYSSSLSPFWKELYNLYIYTQAFSIFSHLFNLI